MQCVGAQRSYSMGSGITDATVATSLAQNRATALLNQGSEWIPSQSYHDVIVTYKLSGHGKWAGRLWGDSVFAVGVQNVLNDSPPIIASTITTLVPGYSTYGDGRLRRYSISLKRSF